MFKKGILFYLSLFTIWILLAGVDIQEIIIGASLGLLLTIVFFSRASIFSEINVNFKAIIYILLFFLVFLWELIKSNLDVAIRVIQPKIPINPGIVKVKTKLRSRLGRTFLANSITLTPGTLTVETDGEDFYIHWIDVTSDNIEGATEAIVSKFERYLEVIFG